MLGLFDKGLRAQRRAWPLVAIFAIGIAGLGATQALADGPPGHFGDWHHSKHHGHHAQTCAGTPEAPGTLAGSYSGDVTVEGVCAVNGGEATVRGDLTLEPGSALIAAFALNDIGGSGTSSLTVRGDVRVREGAIALIGCEAAHFPCLDDNPAEPTLSSQDAIGGDLVGREALGIIVHDSRIRGDVRQRGGGGGFMCEPVGFFNVFGSPVFSDYEDNQVGGDLTISGLSSCWMGVLRNQVRHDVRIVNNQLADPDAIEIGLNEIAGDLRCMENSQVWDSAEAGGGLFPRIPQPNTVAGKRKGQCVLSSPESEGGPLGPGPF